MRSSLGCVVAVLGAIAVLRWEVSVLVTKTVLRWIVALRVTILLGVVVLSEVAGGCSLDCFGGGG